MLKLLLVGALGIGAAAAQTPGVQRRTPAPAAPYQQLFQVKPTDVAKNGIVTLKRSKPARQSAIIHEMVFPEKQHAAKPRVERGPCNMPIIVADASVDPGILITKKHGKPEPRIRVIEPPACWTK